MTKARSNATAPAAKGQIVVGTGTDASGILSVGSANQVLTVDSSTATGLKWATPASGVITWTKRTNPASSTGLGYIHHNGSLWVAVGQEGTIRTSSDGITWTSRTSGTSNYLYHVRFANSLWVACGASGTLLTSTDAITWTSRTANMGTNPIYKVKYLNSLWVAVGGGANNNTGGIATSTDGLTWTRRTTTVSTNNPDSINDVAYGNGYFVAVGEPNNQHTSFYSTDGTSWTAFQVNSTNPYYGIYYDGSNWIACSSSTNNTRYVASVPTGTWANWTNNFILETFGATGAHAIFEEYDNKMFAFALAGSSTAPRAIASWSKGSTGTFTTEFYSPTDNLPAAPLNVNGLLGNYRAFGISTTGQIVVGDSQGRIYSGF